MNLEAIIQSKVSQKKKNRYCMFIYIYICIYIYIYICYRKNLEKWYWWTYLQGKNGDADIDNGHGQGWEEERLRWIETGALTYRRCCVLRYIASGNLCYSAGSSARCSMTAWGRGQWRGRLKRKGSCIYMCMHTHTQTHTHRHTHTLMADSLCHMARTNTTFKAIILKLTT